jgi:transcriptional regulator with XRE-family HTH domain
MGLRDLRDERSLSQQELATAAQVSKATIVNLEAGRIARPYPSTVRKLAAALGLPPRELLRHVRPDGGSR